MFAALSCAATMVIQIPIATGYLNFGDGLCLLAGWILGPWYGFAAGIVITLMLIVTAKPLVGKGYLYPLIPFDRKKLARLLYRRPVTKKNS